MSKLAIVIVCALLAVAYRYLHPCECESVTQHLPWIAGLIGATPVCLAVFFTFNLIGGWCGRNPQAALGTAVMLSPGIASGISVYWVTHSWLWALVCGAWTLAVLVAVCFEDSDTDATPLPPNGNSGGGPRLLLEYHPARDDCDNGGEAARSVACA